MTDGQDTDVEGQRVELLPSFEVIATVKNDGRKETEKKHMAVEAKEGRIKTFALDDATARTRRSRIPILMHISCCVDSSGLIVTARYTNDSTYYHTH